MPIITIVCLWVITAGALLSNSLAVCLIVFSNAAYAEEITPNYKKNNIITMDFSSENYSESFSILDLYNDDPSFVKKGGSMYSHTEFSLNYRFTLTNSKQHSYSVGYFNRYDLQAQHSNGAAKLYYASNYNSEDEELALSLKLELNILSSQGLRLGYQWDFNENASWLVYLDIGQGEQLMTADVNGSLQQNLSSSSQVSSLEGDVRLDYYYQNYPVYSRKVKPAKGQVLALSTQFDFNTEASRHSFLLKDLYFLARWPDAPHTANQINTQRVLARDDGSFNIRPLGSGREDFKSLDQRLVMRIFSAHELRNITRNDDIVIDINRVYLSDQIKVGWQRRLSKQQLWQLKYSVLTPAIEVALRSSSFSFNLNVDHYNVNLIQQLNMSLGYSF